MKQHYKSKNIIFDILFSLIFILSFWSSLKADILNDLDLMPFSNKSSLFEINTNQIGGINSMFIDDSAFINDFNLDQSQSLNLGSSLNIKITK